MAKEDVFDTHGKPGSGCPRCAQLQRELEAARNQELDVLLTHWAHELGAKDGDDCATVITEGISRLQRELADIKAGQEASALVPPGRIA